MCVGPTTSVIWTAALSHTSLHSCIEGYEGDMTVFLPCMRLRAFRTAMWQTCLNMVPAEEVLCFDGVGNHDLIEQGE